MIARNGPSLYRINLIRDLREREHRVERQKRLSVILSLGCFGFFALSLIYSGLTIWQMEHVINLEKDKLRRLEFEYQKYTATKLIVDKSDIELLNSLQGKGIFWTRKLAAIAKHLPDGYSITVFDYQQGMLHVRGHGVPGPEQDQLLVLDQYLNDLRADTSFSNIFTRVFLNMADRNGEGGKVGFDFSAVTKEWKAQ
jgi:hypothetical protein